MRLFHFARKIVFSMAAPVLGGFRLGYCLIFGDCFIDCICGACGGVSARFRLCAKIRAQHTMLYTLVRRLRIAFTRRSRDFSIPVGPCCAEDPRRKLSLEPEFFIES